VTIILAIFGAIAAFWILAWLLMRVARKLGREEGKAERAEDAERIKDEQLKIAARRPRTVRELLDLMRGRYGR
jgi:flagellar biogenesis protein FliO